MDAQNWHLALGILVVGILIGGFIKLVFSTFIKLCEILSEARKILNDGARVTDMYNEVYPKWSKMRDMIQEVMADKWKIQKFHDRDREFEQFKREFEALQKQVERLKLGLRE